MNDWVIEFVAAGVLTVVLLFVVAPGVFLRLALRLFPKDDVRRVEYLADFYCVPRRHRPSWVLGQLLRCVSEGPIAQARVRKERKSAAARVQTMSFIGKSGAYQLHVVNSRGEEFTFDLETDSEGVPVISHKDPYFTFLVDAFGPDSGRLGAVGLPKDETGWPIF